MPGDWVGGIGTSASATVERHSTSSNGHAQPGGRRARRRRGRQRLGERPHARLGRLRGHGRRERPVERGLGRVHGHVVARRRAVSTCKRHEDEVILELRAVRVVVDQGRRALAVAAHGLAHGRDGARARLGALEVPAAPADDLVLAVAAPFQPRARARDDGAVGVVRVADQVLALGRRPLQVVDEDAVRALLAYVREDVRDGRPTWSFVCSRLRPVVAALPGMLAVVHISYALRRTVARARMQVGSQTCKSSACAREVRRTDARARLFVQLKNGY